ncbi:MAG: hypothetical protein ACP5QB_11675 [Thiomonas sp.]
METDLPTAACVRRRRRRRRGQASERLEHKKTDTPQSYISAAYDWGSQAVHLSPLGDQYLGYKLKYMDSGDFALSTANTWVHKLCHECAQLVADQDKLRDFYFQQVMAETYEMLVARPSHYMDMAAKGGQFRALTEEILEKPFRVDRVRNAAIGAPPQDPYLLSFEAPLSDVAVSETSTLSTSGDVA